MKIKQTLPSYSCQWSWTKCAHCLHNIVFVICKDFWLAGMLIEDAAIWKYKGVGYAPLKKT